MGSMSFLGFAGALLVAVADQTSKKIVEANLAYGEVIPVTSFFNLVYHHNRGAIFGMFASGSTVLLVIGVAAILVLGVLLARIREDRWGATALALMQGGAMGNVLDRLQHGAVVDWLDFHAAGRHWPAFNLADSALLAGVAVFLLADFVHRRRDLEAGNDK